ncbi:hypothetical protein VUR80DRAFT_8721 [Thermomyces stellatus]
MAAILPHPLLTSPSPVAHSSSVSPSPPAWQGSSIEAQERTISDCVFHVAVIETTPGPISQAGSVSSLMVLMPPSSLGLLSGGSSVCPCRGYCTLNWRLWPRLPPCLLWCGTVLRLKVFSGDVSGGIRFLPRILSCTYEGSTGKRVVILTVLAAIQYVSKDTCRIIRLLASHG